MGPKFRLFCVSFLLVVTHQRLAGQNTSGCYYPDHYFFDNDGDGYGTQNYTDEMLDGIIPMFNNSNMGYVFSGNIMYGCLNMAISDLQVAYLEEFVNNSDDCDDTNADIHPGSVWYYDNDGDGERDPNNSRVFNCAPDPKYVKRPAADCNDNDYEIHSRTVWYLDNDGDGKGGSTEFIGCTHPSDQYILTTGDECDEDPNTFEKYVWYFDADGDGYAAANKAISTRACIAPKDYYAIADDCNDNDPLLHPKTVWYIDNDGDGWGGDDFVQSCTQPTGYVSNTLDYDDDEPCITNIYPQTYYRDAMKNLSIVFLALISTFARCQKTNILSLEEYKNIKINGITLENLRKTEGVLEELSPHFGNPVNSNVDENLGIREYNFEGFQIGFNSTVYGEFPFEIGRFDIKNSSVLINIKNITFTLGDHISVLGDDVVFNTKNDGTKGIVYSPMEGWNNYIGIYFNQETKSITAIYYIEMT